MPPYALPFEKPVTELESKLKELITFSETQKIDVSQEIERMKRKISDTRKKIYSELTPWQKVQVARHPLRPYTLDYIQNMTTDFLELHGDRLFRDDRAVIGGFASIDGQQGHDHRHAKGPGHQGNLRM